MRLPTLSNPDKWPAGVHKATSCTHHAVQPPITGASLSIHAAIAVVLLPVLHAAPNDAAATCVIRAWAACKDHVCRMVFAQLWCLRNCWSRLQMRCMQCFALCHAMLCVGGDGSLHVLVAVHAIGCKYEGRHCCCHHGLMV